MKYIFLGYSRLQKGYRCYSPQPHRYFLSIDVTFFEDSPFFSSSESHPITEVLPLPIISPPIFDDVPSRPLQVYHHRHRSIVPLPSAEVPADSLPIPLTSSLPIALRKSNQSTSNPHPIYNFLSYHRLSSPYSALVSTISSVSLPKNTNEALSHPGWRQAMVDEMGALHSTGTWDHVVLLFGKFPVGRHWVSTVKVGPDGRVEDILRFLVLIMVTHSPRLPRLLLSVSFSPLLLCVPSRFISWILKMSAFMVILPRKFIWSNHLVLLLRGSLV